MEARETVIKAKKEKLQQRVKRRKSSLRKVMLVGIAEGFDVQTSVGTVITLAVLVRKQDACKASARKEQKFKG